MSALGWIVGWIAAGLLTALVFGGLVRAGRGPRLRCPRCRSQWHTDCYDVSP